MNRAESGARPPEERSGDAPRETAAPLRVVKLESDGFERWNAFVRAHPDGTFFHLAEWSAVVRTSFGHPDHYLLAEREGRIEGVLPLGEVRSRLFGNALLSSPFCVYGGVVAATDAARIELERAACELAARLRVDYLELRYRRRTQPDWFCRDLYVTFRKEIAPDAETNLASLPRKQRAMVRKGINAGLVSVIDANTDRFFPIYAESVRNLGTPVFPRKLFTCVQRAFRDACEVSIVERDGRPVAGAMSFYFRDEVLPYFGGGTAAARDVAANDFLYWEVLRRATERGCRIFDFGRSKRDTGSFHFKRHWGFEPSPLFYECRAIRRPTIPDVNPLNPRYRVFIEMWKRMPLSLSKVIGPFIARGLG